jgi:hypothetical protein
MVRITDYFSHLLGEIRRNAWLRNEDITFREIGENEGYIRGTLDLHDGHELHMAEYAVIEKGHSVALKYRFQLQGPEGEFVARWDNAPHHKEISSFPHHKHCRNGDITASSIKCISQLLERLDAELYDHR